MPQINIRGAGAGAGGPAAAKTRADAWSKYQAQQGGQESPAMAALRGRQEQEQKVRARQEQDAWKRHDDAAKAEVRERRRLLAEEQRLEEFRQRSRQRAAKEDARQQSIAERAEKARVRNDNKMLGDQHREAAFENTIRTRQARYRDRQDKAEWTQQKKEDAIRDRQIRAEAYDLNKRADRREPYNYVRRGVAGLGANAAEAARGGDPIRAAVARWQLRNMESRVSGRLSKAGPAEAVQLRKTLESIQDAKADAVGGATMAGLERGVLGKAAIWGIVAAKLGTKAWNAPKIALGGEDAAMSAAAPYTSLQSSVYDIAGGSGFSGPKLLDRLAHKTPLWRQMYGVTDQGYADTVNAYGVAPKNIGGADSIVQGAAAASYAPYLQGIGRDNLAAAAGGYRSLSGSADDMNYYRRLQTTMETAFAHGVDKSKAMSTLTRVLDLTASSGRQVDIASSSDYVAKMIGAGGSYMRSGAGVVASQQGMLGAISGLGYGGNTVGTMALLSRGVPKSASDLEGIIGHKRSELAPGDQVVFDNALEAAKSGSSLTYATLVAPLMSTDSWATTSDKYGGGMGVSSPTSLLIRAGISGAGIQGTATADAAKRLHIHGSSVGLGWGEATPALQQGIVDAAAKYGIDPATLAALISRESGFKSGQVSSAGARGYGQIMPSTFADAQKRGIISKNYKLEDVDDPHIGPEIAAAILRDKVRGAGGNSMQGIRNYLGKGASDGNMSPAAYADDIAGRAQFFQNIPVTANTAGANVDQGHVAVGEQNMALVDAIAGKWGAGVTSFAQGVAAFTTAATKLADAASRIGSGGGAGAGGPHSGAVSPHNNKWGGGIVATP